MCNNISYHILMNIYDLISDLYIYRGEREGLGDRSWDPRIPIGMVPCNGCMPFLVFLVVRATIFRALILHLCPNAILSRITYSYALQLLYHSCHLSGGHACPVVVILCGYCDRAIFLAQHKWYMHVQYQSKKCIVITLWLDVFVVGKYATTYLAILHLDLIITMLATA